MKITVEIDMFQDQTYVDVNKDLKAYLNSLKASDICSEYDQRPTNRVETKIENPYEVLEEINNHYREINLIRYKIKVLEGNYTPENEDVLSTKIFKHYNNIDIIVIKIKTLNRKLLENSSN